jgi:hypothetical protein
MRLNRSIFLAGALTLLCAGISHAATFNAVTDFSSSNPNGAWSYGTGTTGTSFTAMTNFNSPCNGTAGSECWQPATTYVGTPAIGLNTSGSTINLATVVIPTGVLFEHPAPGLGPADSIVRFTAPAARSYTVTGLYELLDTNPTGIIAEIFDNGTQVFTSTLTGPGASHPNTIGGSVTFSFTETLADGDTLSFGVNNDHGAYFGDSTGFDATITSVLATVPEPTSLLLFGAGMVGIAGLRPRRLHNRVH